VQTLGVRGAGPLGDSEEALLILSPLSGAAATLGVLAATHLCPLSYGPLPHASVCLGFPSCTLYTCLPVDLRSSAHPGEPHLSYLHWQTPSF
jgi:hypothetical protein